MNELVEATHAENQSNIPKNKNEIEARKNKQMAKNKRTIV